MTTFANPQQRKRYIVAMAEFEDVLDAVPVVGFPDRGGDLEGVLARYDAYRADLGGDEEEDEPRGTPPPRQCPQCHHTGCLGTCHNCPTCTYYSER